ncbi:MAG: TIGR01777 family oxidoreductase [Bacteroidetes bacterium]|nr:TIGR01777 family oxidoreductase [Bacteroidota bacterium]
MSKKILITGASGLVGTHLTQWLQKNGYLVVSLVRSPAKTKSQSFLWNPETGMIDGDAFKGVNAIVHLAGAGIADKRWNKKRKKEILESRVLSTRLLWQTLEKVNHTVEVVVMASAIGYYGFFENEKIATEEDNSGNDFLARVTEQWELEADQFHRLNIRTVKIRIGVVLSKKGGALTKMAIPVRWGIGAPLGKGKQYVSWIHIDDLCRIFEQALSNEKMRGAYNAAAGWCTNTELTKNLAEVLQKPLWLPAIPAVVLKIILGERADLVLKGGKVSSEKLKRDGFIFQYQDLRQTLKKILTL